MIRRIPFIEAHFDLIDPIAGTKDGALLGPMLENGLGTTWLDDTEVLACAGFVERAPKVYWAWLLPSLDGGRVLLRVVRFVKRWMATLDDESRIEAVVAADFAPGLRLVEMLGFERETGDQGMRLWDGHRDHHLYARVKNGSEEKEAA